MELRPEVRALFPPYVRGEELTHASAASALFPEEEACVARAVDKRKSEFAMGRSCARAALQKLGVGAGALVPRKDRSVPWPAAAWGSITHADDYCAAVAARRSDVRGIGIDAERSARMHRQLWKQIASAHEIAFFERAHDEAEARQRAALLFSAKETFYKAQFCASSAWVGFHDAQVELDVAGGFELTLLVDVKESFARGTRFQGKYCILGQHVVTGLVITR